MIKTGTIVRILKPHGFTVEEPVAIVIEKVTYTEQGEQVTAWRCLCDDRTVLLHEEEFEVIEEWPA
tara:strand:- start:168 stop:365 length:198 start_codon:yes stop_codon:yes gene_type:complete